VADETDAVPDMDPRWPRLLAAARAWRAGVIPRTSTGLAAPTRVLLECIEDFDAPECDHPRAQRVFNSSQYIELGYPSESCGRCGADLSDRP